MDILSQEITIIVVATFFFLLVGVGIIVLFLIYQKRQLRYILEKKELSNQFQRELLKTRLEAQEETLSQLGVDLHDNIGQLLSSSKFLIGVAERSEAPAATLQLADETISKAIYELRAMSKALNTEWLERFNLIENLQTESDRITASKELSITLQHPASIDMPVDRQIMLFRIVQEALQNSIKHAKASMVSIVAEQKDNTLEVSITDNGKGFDVNNVAIQGVGVTNIRHRAQLMGGIATWNSSSEGTTVLIQLPNQNAA
jgi:signal transduction histidine kinase